MKGTPQEFMHVGIVHYMAFPRFEAGKGPIMDTMALLADDDYFQAVEVTRYRDEVMRKEAAVLLRHAGKRIVFGAQPVILRNKLNLNAEVPAEHTRALDMVKEAMTEAAEWGAEGLALISGPDPGEEKRAEARERLLGSLKELCEFSRTQDGPPIYLESCDRVDFGRNCLIGPTAEARGIAHGVVPYYPRFGLMLDLGHLALLGEDPAEAVRIAVPFLKHAHISNCVMRDDEHPAYGDEHPPFGTEGSENTVDDVALFLRALLEAGYLREGGDNIVSFEIRPLAGQQGRDAIDNAKSTLDAAWMRL